jgi:hypothetical protein
MIRREAGLSVRRFRELARHPREHVVPPARAGARRSAGEGAVAAAGVEPGGGGRARLRAPLPGLGAPQDLAADDRRRPQGLDAHRAPDPRRARAAPRAPLPGRAARAR